MRRRFRGRPLRWAPGGIVTYALPRLREEIAYIAYHFHWQRDEILDLTHGERQEWVNEIARINTRVNEGG
ncbi:hypothetical protein ADK51_27315 [Streptomyces sp. WM6368]|nr:hypothetical protein ADK51_27315 [Streptomyces sp. WM6368]